MDGSSGEQTKQRSSGNRLSSCSSRRNVFTINCHGVTKLFAEPILFRFNLFSCIISTLCVPSFEYHLINPTTQVALFARCIGNCSSRKNITWNIYQGSISVAQNITRWTLFNQSNLWFFGKSVHRTCLS